MKQFILLVIVVTNAVSFSFSQSLGMPTGAGAWTDPALNHNRLIQQRTGEGTYKIVGPYKVKGTPFLFGEKHKGDIFSETEKAWNITVSYNIHNQELEFYSTSNANKALVKEPGTLDSFFIHENQALGITSKMKFIYGKLLGANDKFYYLEVYKGSRFSLYKRYKADLGYVSDNYIQSELRQFDLEYEYYYLDNDNKKFKKLKQNPTSIVKEFKDIKDLSTLMTGPEYTANPEAVLKLAFDQLNLRGF
jgi:hypothetical protein